MTNEINDINKQAKQGSVAAIIQVLNEKLAASGVRTRAIFADGVLQLLCEAPTLDQLDQPILVERIRGTLEEIAPRSIRRVNINSRIVREQQLLWLDEISRDRDQQVLWAEEITLKKPNVLKQLVDDWSSRRTDAPKSDLAKAVPAKVSPQKLREKQQFWRGLAGGALVSCGLLAAGWFWYDHYGSETGGIQTTSAEQSPTIQAAAPTQPAIAPQVDPFANAVRLAERTSQASQTANSAAEWLGLAADWQKASDLMAQVKADDSRYPTAQGRVTNYRSNSEIALQKARQIQSTESSTLAPTAPDSSTGQL